MTPLLALLLVAQPAEPVAEWWYVAASDDLGPLDVFYSDRASARRTGDRVQIDEARESDVADRNGTTGARLHVEYDCRAHTTRILVANFIGIDGQILNSAFGDEEMVPVPASSTADALLRFACGEEGRDSVGPLELRAHATRIFPILRNGAGGK